MRINKIMSHAVVTVSAGASSTEAAALMKEYDIRHLPVVDQDRLVGLVTLSDVREALFPSMLTHIQVRDLMVSEPITIGPEALIEEAARIIYRRKIGCLPVVDEGDRLVGILTVADLLTALIEFMGFLTSSSRLDVVFPGRPEDLAEACRIIQQNGGELIGISLTHFKKNEPTHLFRLRKTDLDPIVSEMEAAGFRVVSSLN
jgi:acetoin utilization protein AcuB